ncbi:FecR family protein [Peristeroidobacter soli]|uniref:FecR family protein n=1 Tax=Peristeroidobacter soli TaxID=2497877 RepID=UPI00158C11D3|nr:FecR domain-containing protein [Peristeroidobacter soli]
MTSTERAVDQRRARRLSEASDWLVRLEGAGRTEAEYLDWLRWCDEDPENFAAFEQVQRQWRNLDALKEAPGFRMQRPRLIAAWAIAAGIAVITATLLMSRYDVTSATAPTQSTASLPHRATTLPDGSKMILGARSRVNMDFNGPNRQLDLSSGEAYFKVKHDEARSFVVRAGEVSVTAVGTAFDVRRYRDKITVTVEEGTVEVRGMTQDRKEAVWRTEAGYQLTYFAKQRTASLASVDPATVLAWRNGELAYIYEPLGSVVEDLNRYSTRKIIITDPEVARIPFTGTAFAASLDGWLAGVNQAYDIDIEPLANGDVLLSRK